MHQRGADLTALTAFYPHLGLFAKSGSVVEQTFTLEDVDGSVDGHGGARVDWRTRSFDPGYQWVDWSCDFEQLLPPFDGDAPPVDVAGTWSVTFVPANGSRPPPETLVVALSGQALSGTVEPQGRASSALTLGRVAGDVGWYAFDEGHLEELSVRAGRFSGETASGVYWAWNAMSWNPPDRGTWAATRQ
jgi:hypothetical protein